MAKKKGSTRQKPAQAVEAAQPVENVVTEEGQVTARPIDYLRATCALIWNWIKTHKRRTALMFLALVAIGGLAGVLVKPSQDPLTNDEIVTLVNKTLSISGDAHPAILTVTDKTLATQPFLDGAENGDKILLYYKAKKAVVFRPSQNSIIHQGSYTPSEAKIFVRRGTQNIERMEQVKGQLETIKEIKLVSQDESTKKDYEGLILVNVTDRYDDKVRELESLFGVKAVRLPAGESFPDADILIIVGS